MDLGPLLADGRLVRSLSLRGTRHLVRRGGPAAVADAAPAGAGAPLPGPVLRGGDGGPRPGRDRPGGKGAAGRRAPPPAGPRAGASAAPSGAGRAAAGGRGGAAGADGARAGVLRLGSWGTRPNVALALAGEPAGELPGAAAVLRHLAAFGPAGVRDFQSWSGPTRTRAAFEALRPGLRVYRDERGTELFDLPDAPLADPERPVPVRFLPAYDNLLLGHADRTRVVADAHRPLVMPGRALVRPTFLLDGSVAGTWAVAGAELRISPFAPLPASRARAVTAEAERLAAFLGPEWRVAFAAE
ncbi:DNA glycosylase AlkZ-like family protein [Kitasatospora sp. NPDC090308]|uniref:DNA glycosylase AlkZ-like family protein n=1 Tax=Kitasatospora sp. NPDC090308 TaxID=3364082 RepID=UPI0037FF6F6A